MYKVQQLWYNNNCNQAEELKLKEKLKMKLVKKNVRYFNNSDEYIEYYEKHEHFDYVTDIVEDDDRIVADAEYRCKSIKTAIKKLAAATGWNWILAELECDEHSEMLLKDCDSVSIMVIDEDLIYIAARQYK